MEDGKEENVKINDLKIFKLEETKYKGKDIVFGEVIDNMLAFMDTQDLKSKGNEDEIQWIKKTLKGMFPYDRLEWFFVSFFDAKVTELFKNIKTQKLDQQNHKKMENQKKKIKKLLKKILDLICFIEDTENLEEEYANMFRKRIIEKSSDLEFEKELIAILKGSIDTKEMSQILNQTEYSKQLSIAFEKQNPTVCQLNLLCFDFNKSSKLFSCQLEIGSKGIPNCKELTFLSSKIKKFSEFFRKSFDGKEITSWKHEYSNFELAGNFGVVVKDENKNKETIMMNQVHINVDYLGGLILLKFNSKDEYARQDLLESLNFDEKIFKHVLNKLLKLGILKRRKKKTKNGGIQCFIEINQFYNIPEITIKDEIAKFERMERIKQEKIGPMTKKRLDECNKNIIKIMKVKGLKFYHKKSIFEDLQQKIGSVSEGIFKKALKECVENQFLVRKGDKYKYMS